MVLAFGSPGMHAFCTERGSWGSGLTRRNQVGTLLLGGKSRAELSAPAKADGTVASRGTPPRIHVVRLPKTVDRPVTDVTVLEPKAS
jgi:hypothetical protein